MNNFISLIEDHHQALAVWRKNGFRNVDLVHLDAHLDFGFYQAKPKEQVIKEATSLNQLKEGLENSLLYQRFERDFGKQANIGNYIYPAILEGIVKDFYWVVPGHLGEFEKSKKIIKNILKALSKNDPYPKKNKETLMKEGLISTGLLGKRFTICTLEKLPILREKVLLDIDTDFLITDNLLEAANTAKIGKRKPWVNPAILVKDLLLTKKLNPLFITIAYSVNGGYTPMRYKILGDELAYRFSPRQFQKHYKKRIDASFAFIRFQSTADKKYYQRAMRLNPGYRAADNNYGPLYLNLRKFSKAKKEFLKVARADPKNPHPFLGLGRVALEKKDFPEARRNFTRALKLRKDLPVALFGLGETAFRLGDFEKAKNMFYRYKSLNPLQPQSYYYLGRIYEGKNDFKKAAAHYQNALRLGLNDIGVLSRLLKISNHLKLRQNLIAYVRLRYRHLKSWFGKMQKEDFKGQAKVRQLQIIKRRMLCLERKLKPLKNYSLTRIYTDKGTDLHRFCA